MWSGMGYGEEDVGISDSRRPGKPMVLSPCLAFGAMFSVQNFMQRHLTIEL